MKLVYLKTTNNLITDNIHSAYNNISYKGVCVEILISFPLINGLIMEFFAYSQQYCGMLLRRGTPIINSDISGHVVKLSYWKGLTITLKGLGGFAAVCTRIMTE